MAGALKTFKKDLPRNIVKFYSKCKDLEEKKEFLKMYGYAVQMCHALDIELSVIDFTKFIADDRFIAKNLINKELYGLIKKDESVVIDPSEANKIVFPISNSAKARITELAKHNDESVRINNDIKTTERSINDYARELTRFFLNLKNLNIRLEAIEGANGVAGILEKEFNIIAKMKEFKDFHFDENSGNFYALTAKEIYCENYNFGTLCVRYDVKNNVVMIVPHSNNFDWTKIHPHVFSEGRVCYGNASASIYEYYADRTISKIYSIIDLIFKNYNKESPVTAISRYKGVWRPSLADVNASFNFSKDKLHPKFWTEVYPEYLKQISEKAVVSNTSSTSNLNDIAF
jgi:hypothetical protein